MANQGSFIASVYTSSSAIPIAGATVLITRSVPRDEKPELISIQITDASGRTSPVQIDTPDTTVSQQPNQGTAWSSIDVSAHHPRFEQMKVFGVQIFPGTTTVQNFQLIPLAAIPQTWNRSETFVVSPQNL